MVFLAGLEAQRKRRVSSVRSYHAHSDYLDAVDLQPFSESMEEMNAWLRLLMVRTRAIVNSEAWWAAIEGLARILMEKRTLSGREVHSHPGIAGRIAVNSGAPATSRCVTHLAAAPPAKRAGMAPEPKTRYRGKYRGLSPVFRSNQK